MSGTSQKATSINLLDFKSPPMRAFHVTWFAFFLCFFGWFGIAPLTAVVREEFHLTREQLGNIMIASVAITILARLFIGWLCDRLGPRLCYTGLLTLGALPVMGIGLADRYETFLLARLFIGVIGASFVITQYHTSRMFAPNCVGLANATTAGWGNMGGGVTQSVMPALFGLIVAAGANQFMAWRLAMIVPGVLMLLTGAAYYRLTQDTPEGNLPDLRRRGLLNEPAKKQNTFWAAAKDPRVWALFWVYGACFGVELIIHNMAALYFKDQFGASLKQAGLLAGLFGLMAIFARSLGGYVSDRFNHTQGLKGRRLVLFTVLLAEGVFLCLFARAGLLWVSALALMGFGLFVHMSTGATYALVPYVNRDALGSVSGIVGAGGNVGAVLGGFLFRMPSLSPSQALLIMGLCVAATSALVWLVRFSPADETTARLEMEKHLALSRAATAAA